MLFKFGIYIGDLFPNLAENSFLSNMQDNMGFIQLMAVAGFLIIPHWLFTAIIYNVCFWLALQMNWAIIEWFYNKIPGVN